MVEYQGKKVVIAGLGLTGMSCIDFFLAHGITPRVMDTRSAPPELDKVPAGLDCHVGELRTDWLLDADVIIASPGIPLRHPALLAASQAGKEIIGDIELFCRVASAPIVAITGSNGKSTVTTLLGEMAHQAGIRVATGGNLGVPALRLPETNPELYVLELSSFQLETTFSLRAAAACVLNISADHMDRYPEGIAQYRSAKLRIYRNASWCVSNAEDVLTQPVMPPVIPGVRFGINRGDYRLTTQQQEHWLTAGEETLLNVRQMALVGQHNYANALAALALADAIHLPRSCSLAALQHFAGLPHRFQRVQNHNGVSWINDSKATNVGSTVAALQGAHPQGRLHLLLGGDGKSADFSPLKPYLQAPYLHLYCYGRDRQQLAALCPDKAQQTQTLQQAMQLIATQTRPGDMVLLSPACASLDQFKNFEQRGEEFTRMAQELG